MISKYILDIVCFKFSWINMKAQEVYMKYRPR